MDRHSLQRIAPLPAFITEDVVMPEPIDVPAHRSDGPVPMSFWMPVRIE